MEWPKFWNAPGKAQSYLNMVYLLISYPLGLLYFIFIVVGLALGFGLFITWFGIPILLGVMFIWLGFAYFERGLTQIFLRIDIFYVSEPAPKKSGIWITLKKRFTDSYTWKTFGYLMLRFPLGVLGFSVLVIFISLTLSFIAIPFMFGISESGVLNIPVCSGSDWCWTASWPIAILVGLLGIFMIFVSMAVFNGLAKSYGYLAQAMLSNRAPKSAKKVVRKKAPVKRAKKSVRKTRKKRVVKKKK